MASGLALLGCVGAVLVTAAHGSTPTARHPARQLPLLAAAALALAPSSSTPVAEPTGDLTVTVASPTDGSTTSAGTAVTLRAALSTDLASALQTGNTCYFKIADDADTAVRGTLDLNARTCTASWTFRYAGDYPLAAWVTTPWGTSAVSATIDVTVTGGTDQRCTGQAGAPATCVYHWVEVYYTWSTDARHSRVCVIDGGCQWQTAHTGWSQVTGSDYWVNSTGQQLPDGDAADAYLCLGSAPANWTSYSSTHDFDALLARAETSAHPVPAGTC